MVALMVLTGCGPAFTAAEDSGGASGRTAIDEVAGQPSEQDNAGMAGVNLSLAGSNGIENLGGSVSTGGADTAGHSGSSSAGASIGGSIDSQNPTESSARISIRLPASTNGGNCPDPGTTYIVGSKPPTQSDPGTPVSNGGSVETSCIFSDTGFGGKLKASHLAFDDSIDLTIRNGVRELDGSIDADFTFVTSKLGSEFTGNCKLTPLVKFSQEMVWGQFSCSSITSADGDQCQVGESVIVFRNCSDK